MKAWQVQLLRATYIELSLRPNHSMDHEQFLISSVEPQQGNLNEVRPTSEVQTGQQAGTEFTLCCQKWKNSWPQMSACEFQLELVIHSSQHHTQVSCLIMHLMHYYSTLEQIIRMILYLQHEKLFAENCRTQLWSAHTVLMEQTPEDAFYQI